MISLVENILDFDIDDLPVGTEYLAAGYKCRIYAKTKHCYHIRNENKNNWIETKEFISNAIKEGVIIIV